MSKGALKMPQWKMENAGALTYGKPSEEKTVRYRNATAKLYTSLIGKNVVYVLSIKTCIYGFQCTHSH